MAQMLRFFGLAAAALPPAAAGGAGNIRVIGAGYGRTGTDSLRMALNSLGFKTYHMFEVFGIGERRPSPLEILGLIPGHNDHWVDAGQKIAENREPDFSFLHSNSEYNFTATVDSPAVFFYDHLFKQNPGAKVILTTRDPEAWHKSINKAFCRLIGAGTPLDRIVSKFTYMRPFGIRWKRMLDAADVSARRVLLASGAREFDEYTTVRICDRKEYALDFFEKWNQRVREIVPQENLLEFETGKHGYKELAEFLSVDDPLMDYPHSNSSEEFQFIVNIHRALAGLTVTAPFLSVWLVLHIWRRIMRWISVAAGLRSDHAASKKED